MYVLSRKAGLTLAVILGLSLNACRAATIAYDNDTTASNQTVAGFNVGLSFTVNQSIEVTSLGAFDSGNVANLAGTESTGVTLGIFDNSTQALVPGSSAVTLTPSSAVTTINGNSFLALATPILLTPGSYMVVAFDDNFYNYRFAMTAGLNPHSTENDGGGLISFAAPNKYLVASAIAYPTNNDPTFTPSNQFMAGTFQFVAAPVPEPASLVLAGCGLFGLIAAARFRRFHARG